MSKNLKLSELDKFVMHSSGGSLICLPVIMALPAVVIVQLFFGGASIVPLLIILAGEALVFTLLLSAKAKMKKVNQARFEYIK